ncbi:MAG: hypothetical protein A2008_04200 [Candidatus Wallbacteria bacterium GWC2_49_35]|uniref:Zinc-ribbon domain-containing protein n=1 Tax=Candidatus Wallbacteria bacterium GWC2_49_35 TaxID=1817813 RepID=A0A1F7WTK9_9BACT|nr:MAG: hypothetical protein A2008_04200 [Candidatus Wallbacteria bacterium GWC2_49_35]HBC76177.1 hypothetical protein [Candidatus Wallbacteria bacterium]
MFCPTCATPNEPGSNFCKQCGASIRSAGGGGPQPGDKPKKKGCCSCSGCLFAVSLIFFTFMLFMAYAIYSGPEFMNKFLAPSEENSKELAALPVTRDDADSLEKNLAEFEKYIQKGGTIEIHLKEIELNSFISRRLPAMKNPGEEVKVKDLKVKLTEDGIRVIGVLKAMKLESYFAMNVKATVDENKLISWQFSGMRVGRVWMPAFVFNALLNTAKKYVKSQPGINQFSFGGTSFQINKIAYLNSKIVIECYNPKKN